MTKHTIGPWRVGDAGTTVFGPKTSEPAPITIVSSPSVSPRVSAEERKANIRLIAAAPDMLEALIMCKDRLETLFDADEATEADIMVLGVVTNVIDAALYKL